MQKVFKYFLAKNAMIGAECNKCREANESISVFFRLSGLREAQRILDRMEIKKKIVREVTKIYEITNGSVRFKE